MEPAGTGSGVPPPRAFSQGVGIVFQAVGVGLFLATALVCCGSGFLGRDWMTDTTWQQTGWADYSVQRAVTVSVLATLVFGLALAGFGLGLQAERASAAPAAVVVTSLGLGFWIIHTIFAMTFVPSWVVRGLAVLLSGLFAILLIFAIGAWRDVRRNPPPPGHEILPADYKVPYSHMHADPPEVRLERELAERRARLETERKELELMEETLRKKMQDQRDA